jgi:hypothetical protein
LPHSTRSYFTFDLSTLAGSTVGPTQFVTDEKSVADCSKVRTEQLWLTDADTAPTRWRSPAERSQLSGPVGLTAACPSGRLVWDATAAVQGLVTAGAKQATFELRLPAGQEADPAL